MGAWTNPFAGSRVNEYVFVSESTFPYHLLRVCDGRQELLAHLTPDLSTALLSYSWSLCSSLVLRSYSFPHLGTAALCYQYAGLVHQDVIQLATVGNCIC